MIRFVKSWIYGDSALTNEQLSNEFRKRHSRGKYLFLIPIAVFVALVARPKNILFSEDLSIFLAFGVFLIAFFYALFYYRCPRCGTTPTSSKPGTTGVLLFPKKCSRCGAPLLPDHRWGQD